MGENPQKEKTHGTSLPKIVINNNIFWQLTQICTHSKQSTRHNLKQNKNKQIFFHLPGDYTQVHYYYYYAGVNQKLKSTYFSESWGCLPRPIAPKSPRLQPELPLSPAFCRIIWANLYRKVAIAGSSFSQVLYASVRMFDQSKGSLHSIDSLKKSYLPLKPQVFFYIEWF